MRRSILVAVIVLAVFALGTLSIAGEKGDKIETTVLNVKGMTCEGCADHVKEALTNVQGVKEAKVDYKKAQATVKFVSATTTQAELEKALVKAGFTGEKAAECDTKKTADKCELKDGAKKSGCCKKGETKSGNCEKDKAEKS